MKRALVSAAVVALLAGGAGVSSAADGGPGPNGSNTFGLCNAYSRGSEQGQQMKHQHGKAFIGLEAAAEAADQTVAEYCAEHGQKPGRGKKG